MSEDLSKNKENNNPTNNIISNNNEDDKSNLSTNDPLSQEEKLKIIDYFYSELKNISLKGESIEKLSLYMLDKIYKYGKNLTAELFQLLDSESHFTPRLEYLYLINDIIGNINLKDKFKDIKDEVYKKIFPYIESVCCYSYSTLNENFRKKIDELIKLWKETKIFEENKIKELEFKLKILIEPKINNDQSEIDFILNMDNTGKIKVEKNLIDLAREIESLNRTKDNKYRKALLKLEKDAIKRELKIHNSYVQQLKEIDSILDKINTFNELEKGIQEEENEKSEKK